MKRTMWTTPILALALAALPPAARAIEPAGLHETLPVKLGFLSEVRVAQETAPAGWGKTTDSARLADLRGGADAIHNEATLGGTVASNSATNVTTGMNIIDNGSFANSSGLPVVIQNSGANVLIQNATVINLQLQ